MTNLPFVSKTFLACFKLTTGVSFIKYINDCTLQACEFFNFSPTQQNITAFAIQASLFYLIYHTHRAPNEHGVDATHFEQPPTDNPPGDMTLSFNDQRRDGYIDLPTTTSSTPLTTAVYSARSVLNASLNPLSDLWVPVHVIPDIGIGGPLTRADLPADDETTYTHELPFDYQDEDIDSLAAAVQASRLRDGDKIRTE